MKWLFWLSVAAVVYGSIFPLIFLPVADLGAEFRALMARWDMDQTSDILANITLFLPYGLFGALAGYRARWLAPSGLALSFALQVAQIFILARNPAIADVLWNMIGLGLAIAAVPAVRRSVSKTELAAWVQPPSLIIFAWLTVFAVPLVPAISPSEIWYSIKPLWQVPGWRVESFITGAAVWLAIGLLLEEAVHRRRIAVLVGLLAVSMIMPTLVAENALERGYVLGGLTGVGLWLLLRYGIGVPRGWLSGLVTGLLVAVLLYRGLTPLDARSVPGRFLWLPFAGALIGPLLQNIRAMLIKLTIYGAMLWLTRGQGRFTALVWSSLLVLVGAIEVAQLYLWSGVPEITDPLVVVLIAVSIVIWERRNSRSGAEKERVGP